MKRYKAIAEYYDAEYAHLEMLERDVPFFLSLIPKRRQGILELAAGTARAAIPLAQAGHRVTAVDYDVDMLAIARRKRDAVGLGDRELSLLKADVLKLDLADRFDHVVIFFNTFYNFTTTAEQDRLLQVARRHLKPRGRLFIDVYHPDLDLLAKPHQTHLDPASFYVPALDRSVHRDSELKQDYANQIQQVTFHYKWFDSEGNEHNESTRFQLTWMFPRELRLLLERNGFRLEKLYGDYDGSGVSDSSPRLISLSRPA